MMSVPVSETMVHDNSASLRTATKWCRYLTMKAKAADFFVTSVAGFEEAEILCTVFSDTGTGTIFLPQAPLQRICPAA
jgi:hypothetical protein